MIDFDGLYRHHAPHVWRYVRHLSGDAALADDITAETFVRVWQTRDRLRHETIRAFLFAIARNLYVSGVRARWRAAALEDVHADPAPDPETRARVRDDQARLERALAALSPADREPLVLRAIEGLSYEAIGQVMDLLPGTAKVRVHRARRRLLALMAHEPATSDSGDANDRDA
ncbi:MAG: RNA polymerase sigma factor [Vicinamibacterales bacterium]